MEISYDRNFCYFLGFIWSDGFIERTRMILEITEEDAMDIIEDIKKIKFLNIKTMKRQRKCRKPQMSIYFCDVKFYDGYMVKYFLNKSHKSPTDILGEIPTELKRYFYLGLIDGDGCFYMSKNLKTKQFYITSTYDQEWSHIIDLFKSIEINQYEIRRILNKNGNRSSYIRIKKYEEIKKLYNYLYPNGYELGLVRKFKKSSLIIENFVKSSNKEKMDIDLVKIDLEKFSTIYEMSSHYNCNWRKIHDFSVKNDLKRKSGFYSKI